MTSLNSMFFAVLVFRLSRQCDTVPAHRRVTDRWRKMVLKKVWVLA